MKTEALTLIGLIFSFLITTSCSTENESDIAKKISLRFTSGALVLANDLEGPDDSLSPGTCLQGGVTGPRVRYRMSVNWSGTEYGNLIPFSVVMSFDDPRFDGEYQATISPGEGAESLAIAFGVTGDDFIPPDSETYSSSICFADFGGLPKPKNEIKGSAQIKVNVRMRMIGVTRATASTPGRVLGQEEPFVKEIKTTAIYINGSVPIGN